MLRRQQVSGQENTGWSGGGLHHLMGLELNCGRGRGGGQGDQKSPGLRCATGRVGALLASPSGHSSQVVVTSINNSRYLVVTTGALISSRTSRYPRPGCDPAC